MVVEIHTNFSVWSWLLDLSSGESSIVSESFMSTWQWRTSMKTRHLVQRLHYLTLVFTERKSGSQSVSFPVSFVHFSHHQFHRNRHKFTTSSGHLPSSSVIFRPKPSSSCWDCKGSAMVKGCQGTSSNGTMEHESKGMSKTANFFRSPWEMLGKSWLIWIIYDRYG